jgi:hypothetical protein
VKGINSAFNEQTTEIEFKKKIEKWNLLTNKTAVAKELLSLNKSEVDKFLESLSETISRFIESVVILPLFGQESISKNITEAINFLKKYPESNPLSMPLAKYEIIVKYNTGDRIDACFKDRKDAIKFLEGYL